MHTAEFAPILDRPGPYATVLLQVDHATEHGAQEHETRVQDALRTLGEQGAPEATRAALREPLAELVRRPAPVARLVVAAGDQLVHDAVAVAAAPTVATWSPLPDLAPWIRHRDAGVRFVLALVDHTGGEVTLWDSDAPEPELDVEPGGEREYAHKTGTGGWAALNFQHTSENVWRHNADAVGSEVATLVRSNAIPLVLVGGDPQSVSLLEKDLRDLQAEVVTLATGQRTADGGDEALQEAIRQELHGHVVRRRRDVVQRLRDAVGQGTSAVGVRAVAEAFVQGRVDTLLIDPDAARDETLDPADHPGLAWGQAQVDGPVPADAALIAAAVATGADVTVLPSAALDGPVAALLRWS